MEKGVDFKVIFDRILSDINIDLKNLENLIYDINCSIDECEEKNISSRIGIASSALLTFGGVISAILTGGTSIPATIIHSVNAAGNLSCGVIHFSILQLRVKEINIY